MQMALRTAGLIATSMERSAPHAGPAQKTVLEPHAAESQHICDSLARAASQSSHSIQKLTRAHESMQKLIKLHLVNKIG